MQKSWPLYSVTPILLGLFLVASPAGAAETKSALQSLQDAFVHVVEVVKPAVVNVSTTQRPRQREGTGRRPQVPPQFQGPVRDFFGEDFFERFFGQPPQREQHSLGSGVIVDKRGYILTNNHVIEQADQIEVRLSDKRKFQATVVGKDSKTDLAVIKIDTTGELPVAPLGDSGKIRIGEWAVAIGNPFGLDQTVTVGVISAVGRSDVGIATYEDFIQTDASINPGNSGGPLVSLNGEVIGINTAIVASGRGIGFAIPINMAREISTRLMSQGKIVRGWLGVGIQELSDELAGQFGVKVGDGVLVSHVMPDGPSERAGLKAGDVILEFNKAKVSSVHQLQRMVAEAAVGTAAQVTVLREKQPLELTVVLGEQPAELAVARPEPSREGSVQRFGLTLQELTQDLRDQLKLGDMSGVLVSGVEEAGPAARAGLRPGDVITQANRKPIKSVQDLTEIVQQLGPGGSLLLLVQREGNARFVVLAEKP